MKMNNKWPIRLDLIQFQLSEIQSGKFKLNEDDTLLEEKKKAF